MAKALKRNSRGLRVKKLQTDLIKLGYNVGRSGADGIFGLKTLIAVREFQKKSDIKADGSVGHFTEMAIFNALNVVDITEPETRHFKLSDFISQSDREAQANGVPFKYFDNIQMVMDRLESIRTAIGGLDIVIRSGYRSPSYNKKVGGARRSQHRYGKAVDIYVKDREISCYELAKKIYEDTELRKLFGGFGLGSDTNLHLDIRTKRNPLRPTTWWYSKKSWKEWGRDNASERAV